MSSFKDSTGYQWQVRIDVNQMRTVREEAKFPLGQFAKIRELAADPIMLVDVLYVLCREQAKRDGIAPEQFGSRMVGDALGDAFDALQDAYLDFCPSRESAPLRVLLAKRRELEAAAAKASLERANEIAADPRTTLNGSPADSVESAESTPTAPD